MRDDVFVVVRHPSHFHTAFVIAVEPPESRVFCPRTHIDHHVTVLVLQIVPMEHVWLVTLEFMREIHRTPQFLAGPDQLNVQ